MPEYKHDAPASEPASEPLAEWQYEHDAQASKTPSRRKKTSPPAVAVQLTDFSVFYSQDSIKAAAAALADKNKAGSKIVLDKGQIVKVTKNAKGIITHEVLTEKWTDWVDYWAVDFDFENKREMIWVPKEPESKHDAPASVSKGFTRWRVVLVFRGFTCWRVVLVFRGFTRWRVVVVFRGFTCWRVVAVFRGFTRWRVVAVFRGFTRWRVVAVFRGFTRWRVVLVFRGFIRWRVVVVF